MANGTTADLPAVAATMHAWQSGIRVRQLISAWPFLRTGGFAEAYERSEAEAIDYRWRQYNDTRSGAPHLIPLHPFISHAFREPRLRALLPYTSHSTLRFSRSVSRPPDSSRLPTVHPLPDGRYRVTTAGGRELDAADAAVAVALVLAALDETSAS